MMLHIQKHSGFTLIEVLVALAIFAIGILGLGLQLGKNISSTINKEVHSSVMQLDMQAVEPLKQAINASTERFNTLLNELNTNGLTPVFSTNYSEKNNFEISVFSATDATNNNLFTTDSSQWTPPFSVVLNVKYNQQEGQPLNFKSTHVFVPPWKP